MSAPDSPNSRTPPSLLSDTAPASEANGSRILANLEGRVVPPAEKKPPRARKPLVVGGLLLVALAAVGAWQLQGRYQTHPAGAAQGDAATTAAAQASGVSAAQTTAASPAPASASQAATIVADDSASAPSASGAASSPDVASASGAADDSRLSRALANGAEDTGAPASATTLAAAPAKNAKSASAAATAANSKQHETVASRSKHEAPSGGHHAAKPVAVAQTQKSRDTKGGKTHDDSDADLLAALVARTKPSSESEKEAPAKPAQSKQSSAKQANAKETSKQAPTKIAASNAGDVRLAERVKECGQKGFFEDQLCRWRVCDGHWGKDPACPTAATTRQP